MWTLRVNDRLTIWKDLRHELSEMPLTKAVVLLNQTWSQAPFVTYYLQPDRPDTWPDPWELLAENYYCDLAKALGILYTIYFTSHKTDDIEIRIYYDYETKDRYNVVWINGGKYILNYWPFEIVNREQIEEKNLQLLYSYNIKDLKLDQY